MSPLPELVEDYMRHAQADYVGLWPIAARVREDLGITDPGEVRQQALAVVKRLLERGLRAGDYLRSGFLSWKEGDPMSVIARITKEWKVEHGDPTLANPICWFAPKPD